MLAVLGAGAAAAPRVAPGADVTLEISTRSAYVNEPVTVQIQIAAAEDYQPPEFPDLNGAVVEGPNTGTMSNVSIINGRMTRQMTVTFTYIVRPTRAGALEIPAIVVRADGKEHRTAPQTIQVAESETGDLMFLSLTRQGGVTSPGGPASPRGSIYFGQTIEVDLEIWIKVYQDRNLPEGLNPQDMLSLISIPQSEWGMFKQTLAQIERREARWQYRKATRVGADGVEQEYCVFVLALEFVPATTGPLDPGQVTVLASYPTRTRTERGFFGGPQVNISGSRPIQATLGTSDIMVLAPPEEGKPPLFNGAVGRYQFTAEAHNTDARVREPIELTLTVTGEGELERVPPPPLEAIEELTRDFKVPEERLSGVVDQRRKRFVVTVRAKRSDVTEIPAIPFVYFDPAEERYVTVHSDPIPVNITQSEQVPIAQFDDSENGAGLSATRLTETGAGIRANYVDMDQVLAQQSFEPGWGTAALLAGSPLAFVVSLLVQRQRVRLRQDQGYARRRRARARALSAVRAASRQTGPKQVAAEVGAAVIGYVTDRCNLPAGLTPAEAVEQLTQRNLNGELLQQVEQLLRHCENLEYAGGEGRASSSLPIRPPARGAATADLAEQARRCLAQLERERF